MGGYVFCLWLCDMERGGPGNKQTKKWGGGGGFQKTAREKKTKITIGPLYRTICCNEKYNIFTLYHREVKNNSVAEITL